MIIILGALLLATESPAVVAPSTEATAAVEAPKEEKKICKRETATESRMGSKRICLTAAEWKARDTGEIEYRRNIKD